jgi:hypothetical protein
MAKRRRRRELAEEVSAARLALRELAALRPSLDRLEAALVDRARLEQTPWEAIAVDLGVTKQTAHRRHARHDPLAERRRVPPPPEVEEIVQRAGMPDEDGTLARLLAQELAAGSPGEPGVGPDRVSES